MLKALTLASLAAYSSVQALKVKDEEFVSISKLQVN